MKHCNMSVLLSHCYRILSMLLGRCSCFVGGLEPREMVVLTGLAHTPLFSNRYGSFEYMLIKTSAYTQLRLS